MNSISNCNKCGAPIDDDMEVCQYCGSLNPNFRRNTDQEGEFFKNYPVVENNPDITQNDIDNPSIVLNIIGFIFPVLGLILYFTNRNSKPQLSSVLLKWCIAGFIKEVISFII